MQVQIGLPGCTPSRKCTASAGVVTLLSGGIRLEATEGVSASTLRVARASVARPLVRPLRRRRLPAMSWWWLLLFLLIPLAWVLLQTVVGVMTPPDASGRFYFPETLGSGCAFFDYDQDGRPDIFLVNSTSLPGSHPPGPHPTQALYNRDGQFFGQHRHASRGVDHWRTAADPRGRRRTAHVGEVRHRARSAQAPHPKSGIKGTVKCLWSTSRNCVREQSTRSRDFVMPSVGPETLARRRERSLRKRLRFGGRQLPQLPRREYCRACDVPGANCFHVGTVSRLIAKSIAPGKSGEHQSRS